MQHSSGCQSGAGHQSPRARLEVASARVGVALFAAFVSFVLVSTASAPTTAASTVVQTWQTRIGAQNALTDTATIQAYNTVKGVLRIHATRLRASSHYTVTIYQGRCGWIATKLFALPSVTTNASGSITKNLALSVAQVKRVRSTWNGDSGVAIQLEKGSSRRCGDFGAYAALGKATRLENEQTHTIVRAETWDGGEFRAPDVGSSYVTVYVRIKARTDTSYNPLDYSLLDGKGKDWSGMVSSDREPALGSGDLAAGRSVEGWVTFMAPTDQLKRLTLAYSMNGMLQGPSLYVPLGALAGAAPLPSPEPTPGAGPPLELRSAVSAGKVIVSGHGINLQQLDLTLTSQVAEPLSLVIDPGTVFHPSAAGTQTMVTTVTHVVTLTPGESKTLTLDVACASMHLDEPGSSDQFGLDQSQGSGALLKLLQVSDFATQSFRVRQFAIWTITDNPPPGGYVGLRSGFEVLGSGPSSDELTTIRQLFVKAGLDPSAYLALA